MAAIPVVELIYGKPMLPDVARVLTCIYEKQINFKPEDMNKGKEIPPDIINLQMSSHGHTPALQDGQDALFGSKEICRHIIEKYGAFGYQDLLGKDPLARVSVEQWIQSEEQKFNPPSSALVFYLAYKIESDEEPISQSEKKLEKVLNLYEQRLGECEFLGGNYFTLADLNHLPNSYYLESSTEFGYLIKDRKNVSRWWNNISSRDSWKNVVKKLKEEGLPIKVPLVSNEAHKSTLQTSSFTLKNGSASSERKIDEHSQSGKEEGAAGNKHKHNPSAGEQGSKGTEKVSASIDEGNTPAKKEKPDTVGENKQLGKDKKDVPESDDRDNAPPGNREKSDTVGENKEIGKDKKSETFSNDRGKTPVGNNKKTGTADENKVNEKKEALPGNNKNPGTVVENKELGKGKKDVPSGNNEKPRTVGENKVLGEDKKDVRNSDDKGKKDVQNSDDQGETQSTNKNNPASISDNKKNGEEKKDKPKSDDKALPDNSANKNENRDTNGSNTKKDSLPAEGKEKTSSENNKKSSPANDMEKKTN